MNGATMKFIVLFRLGGSPASGFYMPTFRNTLFHLHSSCEQDTRPMKVAQSVPIRRYESPKRKNTHKSETVMTMKNGE